MGRNECLREAIKASGSPLDCHSLNQRGLKAGRQGEARFLPPRKFIMAQARRERLTLEVQILEDAKVERITQRVITCLRDSDIYPREIFRREVSYLKRVGISLDTLREMAATYTTLNLSWGLLTCGELAELGFKMSSYFLPAFF